MACIHTGREETRGTEKTGDRPSSRSPAEDMANKKLEMKLLIDTKSQKVLFAEAGKDVIDFLFSLLGMPVGTIVKLLSKDRMVGCIGSLYNSLEGLDKTYLQPNRNKSDLLNPVLPLPAASQNTLLLLNYGPTPAKMYYRCSCDYSHNYVTDGDGFRSPCPSCKCQMVTEVTYVNSNTKVAAQADEREGGLVKGVVTYTIMDDLTVTPMSTISSITLLNKLQVKDMSVLQEKPVELGFEEGVELLKASLQSRNVLTHVFLGEKVVG